MKGCISVPFPIKKNMKNKIQIYLLGLVVLRFLIFIASHYYCVKYDYLNFEASQYQLYYYPLMNSLELLTLSFCVVCFTFIIDAFRATKIISLALFSIDLFGSVIILFGFNFDFYIEILYLIYGLILSFLAIGLFNKKMFAIMITLLLFCSCFSTRDVEKNRIDESSANKLIDNSRLKKDSTSESSLDLNIKKTGENIVINKDQSYTIRETFKPIDNTKSARYNGNEFINAEITTEKTYNKNDNVSQGKKSEDLSLNRKSKANKSEDSKKDIKAQTGNKKKGEVIQSSRTTVNFWWLVPIIIVILIVMFFKNKAKIMSLLKK